MTSRCPGFSSSRLFRDTLPNVDTRFPSLRLLGIPLPPEVRILKLPSEVLPEITHSRSLPSKLFLREHGLLSLSRRSAGMRSLSKALFHAFHGDHARGANLPGGKLPSRAHLSDAGS